MAITSITLWMAICTTRTAATATITAGWKLKRYCKDPGTVLEKKIKRRLLSVSQSIKGTIGNGECQSANFA